jgi:DNA-binding transcriptional LysR family regulator
VQIVPPVHLLQTLVVFAEQENLVQTAERLGLTQPTVSRQLQQLEELFSHALFTVQGRNKVLTDYGLAVVAELKPRFADLGRIFEKVNHSFGNPKDMILRWGGDIYLLERFTTNLSFAGVVELSPLEPTAVESAFREHLIDLAITSAPPDLPDLISKKLLTSGPALAIPKKWAGEAYTVRDWAHICTRHPAIAFAKSRVLLADFERKYKINVRLNFIVESWEAVEKRVHEQKSWAVLPSHYLQENRGYKIIPVSGLSEQQIYYLSYRQELTKHFWMKDLLSDLNSER